MIEELKDEELLYKVGGRFRLTALIQKRLVSLNAGAPSPIDADRFSPAAAKSKLNVAIQEIVQGKVLLEADVASNPNRYEEDIDKALNGLAEGTSF